MFASAPGSVAARLLRQFPVPTPLPGVNGQQYLDQRDMTTPGGTIPAIGRAAVIVDDRITSDQHLVRVDHTLDAKNRVSVRWIGETQHDQGGTSAAPATVGRAMRGSRGPFDGSFGNLNLGYKIGRAHV